MFQSDVVKFLCCCGSIRPLHSVYFCRHCLRLRCHYCVSHEVDSHFCANCSENVPSAEAKVKKNRCNACYDCPICKQTLAIRASTIQGPSDDDPSVLVAKKVYYLICGFCRWSSRDAKIPDKSAATGPWIENETTDDSPLDSIADYFRMLGTREKAAKEKKFVHKGKFLTAGRHGVAHLLTKRFPTNASPAEEMSKIIPPPNYIAPTLGLEDLEPPNKDYLEELNIVKVSTLDQRLHQVEAQSREVSSLLPTHKHLLTKRSLRCRVCERNISKPEYSPVSIKFKIQLNAYYHVPQIRLMSPLSTPFLQGEKRTITLRISNPTQFATTIKFLPFSFVPLKRESLLMTAELDSIVDSSIDSLSLYQSQNRNIKEVTVLPICNEKYEVTCYLEPPESVLILPARDDSSEFDDYLAETPDFNDNPAFVPWRKGNKAAVNLEIIRGDNLNSEELNLGLTMEYDYTNTIPALDVKNSNGSQKVRIQAHLLIKLDQEKEVALNVSREF